MLTDVLSKFFLAISKNTWLRDRIRNSHLGQQAVRQFIPGESVDAALQTAEQFDRRDVDSVLTYLGENIDTPQDALDVRQHYLDVLDEIAELESDTEISVKLTHLGLDLDKELATESLDRLAERADETGSYLWIDMEESSYVAPTLEQYRPLNNRYRNTGLCLQAYLYRTDSDLQELLQVGGGIRLVKGAYREPEDVAFPDKKEIDQNYLELSRAMLKTGLSNGVRPAFATHDDRLIREIQAEAREAGISPAEYEFQMLYGIREPLQRELVSAGYRLRVLISYGEAWYSWYMRRLAERPANALFALRSLLAA